MTRKRAGFTLIELMVVVAIVGIILLVAGPRWATFRQGNDMRSAKQQLVAAITTARQAAIQRGQPSIFSTKAGWVGISQRRPNGDWSEIIGRIPLTDLYGVTVSLGAAGDTAISFDSRGFSHEKTQKRYILALGARRDTVCVQATGSIQTEGCTP